ncbi:alpha-amylase/4-alpha-glucanotransferase domain-containing protein [Desulfonatronum lacustre]|uniref:alpha-amylase/4-alpha-glucanotransferase domain-containing protein n=1 Tax=Desulfonatronum lacustre TaxID=66849 RepID=UPI00048EF8B6|nr:alpha-amylase/4-alpha-glucanotransferase domain-containing protein [Desulfonatronum lacustre]
MSRSPVYFSLVLHFHQPVGNFDHVFANAYDLAYKPLLDHLWDYPDIRVGLHFSGCLLDWLLEHRPAVHEQVGRLVRRGQVEILAGGYYEPVLPMLRPEDAQGQVRMHIRAMEDLWSVTPTGLWLTERVWEPHLPSWLAPLGLRYSLVDDNHLHRAGVRCLLGTWLTEDCGHPLRLLVNLKPLRRLIPWQPLDAVWAMLGDLAALGRDVGIAPLACLGDDAERFGLWPRTHEHCWEQGYMRRFFDGLLERRDWIKTVTPTEYMERHADQGRVYLPTASYLEMMDWAMPTQEAATLGTYRRACETQDISRFLSGGFWRNFLVKYPEVNWLQKRGQDLSRALDGLAVERGGDAAVESGRKRVWASQCNCAYWHGVFGGVYLTHLRQTNAANLLAAQEESGLWPSPHWSVRDVDVDGREELHARFGPWQLFLSPANGAAAKELDYLPKRLNLATAFARHPEPYHQALREAAEKGEVITPNHPQWKEFFHIHSAEVRAKEPGLERFLDYDRFDHMPFADYLLPDETSLDDLTHGRFQPLASSWQTAMTWEVRELKEGMEAAFAGRMAFTEKSSEESSEKFFGVPSEKPLGKPSRWLDVEKSFRLFTDRVEVDYRITACGGDVRNAIWVTELALGLTSRCTGRSHGNGGEEEEKDLEQSWSFAALADVTFACPYSQGRFLVEVSPEATLRHVPLWAVTKSESGFERTPQGSAFYFCRPLRLLSGEQERFRLRLRFVE